MSKSGRTTSLFAAALLAGTGFSTAVQAQDDSATATGLTNEGDLIIVTGTRRTDRTIAESAVPIDVLSADALGKQGYTETNLILSSLVPSFNFPRPSITDGTDSIQPATLRGLSPDQTLVLVNGKRRHASALVNVNGSIGRGSQAVDLNTIPPSAIGRIEVLRDGAAAQYGSDAIAGVINVQLKTGSDGGGLYASYGEFNTKPDGVREVAAFNDNGDGTFNIVLEDDDKRIKDGGTLTFGGDVGVPIGDEGYFRLAGQYNDRDFTNRSGADPRQQYASLPSGGLDPREATFDRFNHRFGNAQIEDLTLFANMAIPFGDAVEAYAFGSWMKREGLSAGFFRRSLDARNTVDIYPDGFLPKINTEITDRSLSGGLRGALGAWSYDASATYGENEVEFDVVDSLNRSLGPDSPTRFRAGGLKNEQLTFNIDGSREFDLGLSEPLILAFGGEYREETYKVREGEPSSYVTGPFGGAGGAQVFPGFQPSNRITGDRDSYSLYTEVDADPFEGLNVQAALRFEDYSDFGSDINWKVAGRYEFIEGLALRGAISTGFRAPSLGQIFFTSTATNFIDGIPNEVGTFPVGSDIAVALGAQPLKAEELMNYSAGFTYSSDFGLDLTVDFYQIEIDDRVVLSENITLTPDLSAQFPGISRARFFINEVDTRTRGFDAVLGYRRQTGIGSFDLSAAYNYNKTDITNDPDEAVFSRLEQRRFERGQPKDKIVLSADWDYEPVGVTLRGTRFGKYEDPGSVPEFDENFGTEWVVDLEARIDLLDHVRISAGANNLFDNYPDRSPEGPGLSVFNTILPFSSFSPFGFNGRYLYGKLGVTW